MGEDITASSLLSASATMLGVLFLAVDSLNMDGRFLLLDSAGGDGVAEGDENLSKSAGDLRIWLKVYRLFPSSSRETPSSGTSRKMVERC